MHLLAVIDQQAGAVLGQAGVDGKTNEITRFAPLLKPLDLAVTVVTADALRRRRHNASYGDPVVMPTCVGACRQPSGKRVTRSA